MPTRIEFWSRDIQRMWEALNEGDWSKAYDISGPLVSLVNLQTTIDVFVAVEKHILNRQGVFTSTAARGPLAYVLDPESKDEVDRLFDRLSAAARPSVGV